MSRVVRCKRCNEPIVFLPKMGFIRRGEPRYYTANADDSLPHYRRCKLKQDLKKARLSDHTVQRSQRNAVSLGEAQGEALSPTQGEMFDVAGN